MTKLTTDSKVARETGAAFRGRPLIAEMHAHYLLLREKGTKNMAMVTYDYIYQTAMIREAKPSLPVSTKPLKVNRGTLVKR